MTGRRLLDTVEMLYCDLDGVVYRGGDPIPGAAPSLNRAARSGVRVAYLTNNASRTPAQVCEQLSSLGLPAEDADVVTSAQACIRMVRSAGFDADTPILCIGGDGLRQALRDSGFHVCGPGEAPAVVVQGFSRDLGWSDLAEASYAIQAGAAWFVTNDDRTLPQERGMAPGNGTLVAAVAAATGILPRIAGKPHVPLYQTAAERYGSPAALCIGDRLDTDIQGANAVGLQSALVLTGVDGPESLYAAPPARRPRYVLHSLDDLFLPVQTPTVGATTAQCGTARVRLDGDAILLEAPGTPGDQVLAVASLIWAAHLDPRTLRVDAAVTASL